VLKTAECDGIADAGGLGGRRAVHRLHRYVPLVVWKWGGGLLLVASFLSIREGQLWPAVGIPAVGFAALYGYGRLTVGSGLQSVLVYDGGLVFAADTRTVALPWAFVEWTVHLPGEHDSRRISGGREKLTVRHEMSWIVVQGMDEPVELLHVRRHRRLIEAIDARIETAVEERLERRLRSAGIVPLPGEELTLVHDGLVVTETNGQRRMFAWPELTAVTAAAQSSLLIHASTLHRPRPVQVANARVVARVIERARAEAVPGRGGDLAAGQSGGGSADR
jgi:hypothetical protein